jgi:hypothetical protein
VAEAVEVVEPQIRLQMTPQAQEGELHLGVVHLSLVPTELRLGLQIATDNLPLRRQHFEENPVPLVGELLLRSLSLVGIPLIRPQT